MQISGLCWRHRNAPVVDRQIALQKPIRLLQGRHPCQPQLFDQSILEGLKEPLHPSLRLGRVGRDQLDSQLGQRPSILTRGFHSDELLVHDGLGRRLIL